jgi:hypothetical protein
VTRDALSIADDLIGVATLAGRPGTRGTVLTRLDRLPLHGIGFTGADLDEIRLRVAHLPPGIDEHDRILAGYMGVIADLAMTAAAELRGTTADPLNRRTP